MSQNVAAIRPKTSKKPSKKVDTSPMGSIKHEKRALVVKENQFNVREGDVISIFGNGERKRVNYARLLTSSFVRNKVVIIDLSKVNDPGYYLKLEKRKRERTESDCMARKRLEDRLRVALEANTWFEEPVQALSLEERAKLLLILELSEQPDVVIINRPTVIRQFNRKLRALRQVFHCTIVMLDTTWNFPLSNASDHTFEFEKGKLKETFVEI